MAKTESGELYEEFDEAIVSNVLPADMDWNEIVRLLLQCDLNGCYATKDEMDTLHDHLNVILESDNIRAREGLKPGLGALGGFWNVR